MKDLIERRAAIEAVKDRYYKYGRFAKVEELVWEIEDLPSAQPEIIRCKDCKHNPKITWFGCPLAHCSETQRPETAWCWKGERKANG